MNKNKFMTLAMGCVLASGMMLTSCGEKKDTKGGEAAKEGEKTEQAEAKPAIELPADCKVYGNADMAAGKGNTSANVAFASDVTVTSEGFMEDNAAVQTLYIDHEINTINVTAFKNCTNLKEIKASAPVIVAQDNAFEGCTALKEYCVDTYTVGVSTFAGCTSLEKVNLGQKGNMINANAFTGCTSLKSIIIPMTVERLDETAFEGCPSIEEMSLPLNFYDKMFTFTKASTGVKKIYFASTIVMPFPTTAAAQAFNKGQCTLYVNDALVEDFKKDADWSKFAAIEPISKSGYYNADGTIK